MSSASTPTPKDKTFAEKEPSYAGIDSQEKPATEPQPQPQPEPPRPQAPRAPSDDAGPQYFTNRLTKQQYHPVVLVGSSASGKTVLVLSLIAYFKSGGADNKLGVFFGRDFFRPTDTTLCDDAETYFSLSVADYIGGTTKGATKIGAPMFIPVKVLGDGRPEAKFAFMESDGEWFQPNRDKPGERFNRPFKPELEALLRLYSDGISFVWMAPCVGQAASSDPDALYRQFNESLGNAFEHYQNLRGGNCARDTHLLLVTKWDGHISSTSVADVREKLSRTNDVRTQHEVDNFISKYYDGPYKNLQALNSPLPNKVVFRYSAGLFNNVHRGLSLNDDSLRDVLRTYPRDVWNWLYEGTQKAHEWEFSPGPLISVPPPPSKTLAQRWDELVSWVIG